MENLQVVVSTMFQTSHAFLEEMNIFSDTIVINQSDTNLIEQFTVRGKTVTMYTLNERGIGLSRNTGLMRAAGDIVLFADDDICYYDSYEETVLDAFRNNPADDILIFELDKEDAEKSYRITKKKKVHLWNYQKYGAAHFAVRLSSIRRANCWFSLLYGGGAAFSCGEDSIFLRDCLKKGLRVKTIPESIGILKKSESTWFRGYTEKYFLDKGRLFGELNGILAPLIAFRFALRLRKKSGLPVCTMYRLLLKGIQMHHI